MVLTGTDRQARESRITRTWIARETRTCGQRRASNGRGCAKACDVVSRICQFGPASASLVLPKPFRDLPGAEPVSPHAHRTTSSEAASHPEGPEPERHPHRRHPQPGHPERQRSLHDRGPECRRIAGETILSGLSRHVRKKLGALGDALSFELDAHIHWILGDLLQQFDHDTVRIAAADRRMEAALAPFEDLIRLLESSG